MAKSGLYAGIDIGTNSIKVIVAEYVQGQMNIIGNGNAESDGLKNGIIVDIHKTAESILKAVNAAQEKAGVQIDTLNVGIPANQLGITPCQGLVQIAGANKEITDSDVVEVVSNALMQGLPPEREVISVETKEFVVDGFPQISDPRGMLGVRLEMKGILYTGPKTLIHNIISAIEQAGFKAGETVITPLITGQQILNDQEREFGSIAIDMGAGQTTVAVMKDNELKYVNTRMEGGDYVTKDISFGLNTSITEAESIKQSYGEADIEQASPDEFFLVSTVGQTEPAQVTEYYLTQIIRARIAQIFEKIKQDLETNRQYPLPGGVVLYGGAAALPGITTVAQQIFESSVRLHVPTELGLRNPAYTQVISTVKYVSQRSDIEILVTRAVLGDYVPTYHAPVAPQLQTQVAHPSVITSEYVAPVSDIAPVRSQASSEVPEEKGPGIVDRARGWLTNMFD
ncbi:MAG: cell division protein FtsA [Streptococcaceae bacterium]|jgi:cell division protein FtsA|nr:cell division protein FtsA [Streptococcaceae bacterium]